MVISTLLLWDSLLKFKANLKVEATRDNGYVNKPLMDFTNSCLVPLGFSSNPSSNFAHHPTN